MVNVVQSFQLKYLGTDMGMRYGKGREYIRVAAHESHDELSLAVDSIANVDEGPSFCSRPADYIWRYIAKKPLLIPFDCSETLSDSPHQPTELQYPSSGNIRLEMRDVLIVEGTLRPGESNILARRRFCLEEHTWAILHGEGYDSDGSLVRCYMLPKSAILHATTHGRWFSLV